MISRSSIVRNAQKATRLNVQPLQRRAFAAAASTGSFDTSDVSGLKVASRDDHGPTTRLAIVSKAGTRYQPLPGLTAGLEGFAFKNTQRRSALRITRESELLGGQLQATHTREALILQASFLREDLPYFAELLAEVVSQTKYTTHEFHEEVDRVLHLNTEAANSNALALALDGAHSVAFHNGLGAPLTLTSSMPYQRYLNEEYIASFADVAFAKSNIAVVADGASADGLSNWVGQFFKDVPASPKSGQTLKSEATKYYGGEQRTSSAHGNAMVIAFPGSNYSASKPEVAVLAALLGGQSSVKWSSGFTLLSKVAAGTSGVSVSASNLAYSDAGLLAVQLSGSAASIRKAADETVKALKSVANGSVSKEDLTKAVAKAKFDALSSQSRDSVLALTGSSLVNTGKAADTASLASAVGSVTAEQLKTAAKTLLEGKASVATVGDLFVLPHAAEIGLQV